MSELLDVKVRQTFGKRSSRRMRCSGHLPAVLYGHGEDPVSLTVAAEQLRASLRHGAKLVELQGAASGQALLHDIQWDTFHQHVLHVDLLRVDAKDRIHVEVPIVLRGEAPGEREGGVVALLVHSVEIETSPAAIPDQLHVNVNHLKLGGEIKASDIEGLPEGAKILIAADQPIVHCTEPLAVPEEEEAVAVSEEAEPEVIGRKAAEEEGEDQQ